MSCLAGGRVFIQQAIKKVSCLGGSLIYALSCVTTLTYHRNRQCGPLVWCDASVFDLYSIRVSVSGNG